MTVSQPMTEHVPLGRTSYGRSAADAAGKRCRTIRRFFATDDAEEGVDADVGTLFPDVKSSGLNTGCLSLRFLSLRLCSESFDFESVLSAVPCKCSKQ